MRLKIFAAILAASTIFTPVKAHAEPISTALIILTAVTQQAAVAVGISSLSALGAIGSAIGFGAQILAGAALSFAANALFAPDAPQAPRPQQIRGSYVGTEQSRFLCMGPNAKGGSLIFGAVKDGNIYKIIAHSDSEVTQDIDWYFDDTLVTFDGAGMPTNDRYNGNGRNDGNIKLFSRPGTQTQSMYADVLSNFPEWQANFVGAGVSDSLMILNVPAAKNRAKVLNNRGVLGLGEPDPVRIAYYDRYYDPRDENQDLYDESTWGPNLGNLVLLAARHRTHPERFAMSLDDIWWENIAEGADVCDELVEDRYGTLEPRYKGGIAIDKLQESMIDAENRILAACDGIVVESPEGKIGFLPGKYYEPTVTLTEADIYDLESSESEDGETSATHFFASYVEPAFGYKQITAAPYISQDYSVGDNIETKNIPLYVCTNHNQAVRITKAAVLRQNEKRRIAITCNLKGMKAKSDRFVRIDLGGTDKLTGVYEIASIKDNYDGSGGSMVLIRAGQGNWDLLDGEEGERANLNVTIQIDDNLGNIPPEDMIIQSGQASRFLATFDPPEREDLVVQIQLREKGTTTWEDMNVRTEDGVASSAASVDGSTYEFRWRVITFGGNASDYSNIVEVVSIADTTPTLSHSNFSISVAGDAATISFMAPNSPNYAGTEIYRSSISPPDFQDAVTFGPIEYGPPNTSETVLDAGLAPGDHHYWIIPINGSGVHGPMSGPETITAS